MTLKDNVIAIREFKLNSGVATVRLYQPKKSQNGDYECHAECDGIPGLVFPVARGIDSFQALIISFEFIRKALKPYSNELEWSGLQKGSIGFPIIPLGAYLYGPEFSLRIENLIDSEIDAEGQLQVKKLKANSFQ